LTCDFWAKNAKNKCDGRNGFLHCAVHDEGRVVGGGEESSGRTRIGNRDGEDNGSDLRVWVERFEGLW
jgi:hypothetical protein